MDGRKNGQDQARAGQSSYGRRARQVAERAQQAAPLQGIIARAGRLARRMGLSLALLAVICAGTLAQFAAVGLGVAPVASAHAVSTQHGKNTFHPSQDLGGKPVVLPGQIHTATTQPKPSTIQRPTGATMQPADLALDPAKEAHLRSSDGRLEVTVLAGSVSSDTLAKAGGPIHLHIVELEGPSGGTNSGDVSLGTYQFTLMGPYGQVAAGLVKPLTLTLHLDGWRGAAFNARNVTLIITKGAAATGTGATANAPATGTTSAGSTVNTTTSTKPTYAATTLNTQTKTVSAVMPFTGSGGSYNGTWNTQSPEAQWSKQTDTSVDLSSGDLTYSYPIDVPTGPGGLTPKLQLSYDSASVTGNHNPMATAGWLGEGWDLSAGSISWGEHNAISSCTTYTCTSSVCGSQNFFTCTEFEDSWQMSDPYGNSGELIPSDSNIAPWYDDTNANYVGGVMNWQLANAGRAKIISYVNPNNLPGQNFTTIFPTANYPHLPPCFRVFLPNGYMEEFGCTLDSLQYYVNYPALNNNLTNYVYRWDLDMITDPNGNQIHFTYRQVVNFSTGNSESFPIDAVLSDITYDSPSCHNTSAMCTGTAWQPAVDIHFDTDYAPARLTGAACPTWTLSGTYKNAQTMRCDDVHDLSTATPKGTQAPTLQSLLVLNDVKVQVTTTPASPSWQTLRTYQFSYDQAPSTTTYDYHNGKGPVTIVDPNTGMDESVAGYLDLTKIQELGTDGSTSLPALAMSYTTVDEYYVDAMNPNVAAPLPSGNCGPAFNTTNCKLWAQSYNARYLTELDNGRGWSETYTWKLARNNTHGVPTGYGLEDPLACTNAGSAASQYPCDEADDENWSRVVLTQRQASVLCVAANGSGCGAGGSTALTSTWSYQYILTDVTDRECGDCTEDMYWGNQNDSDKLDFYNTHFMGFKYVNVTNPDGSLTEYYYNTTEGYGVATSSITCHSSSGCAVAPWTDPANALHGRLNTEWDMTDPTSRTVLKETVYQYNVTCPAPGVAASAHNATDKTLYYVGQNTSELDFNNPVTVCEITTKQVDTYGADGGSYANSNHTTTSYSYSYDSAGHMTQETENTTANNAGSTPNILKRTQYVWDDNVSTSGVAPAGTYLTLVPAIQTTEDGSDNVKTCTYTAYDGGTSGATGQQSSLTRGLETRTDEYSQNCTPGSLAGQVSTTKSYDAMGNPIGTRDADAVAGISGHTDATDCTIGSIAYSACAVFDGYYAALPIQITNALGQHTDLNYTTDGSNQNSPDATNGWGQWLTLTTDPNLQNTQYAYDALGRLTAIAKPGDSISSPTTSDTYPVTCAATGAAEPCTALTTTQRLSGSTTVTSATYYDGWGRAVETVSPQQDNGGGTTTYVVQYTSYDTSGRVSFKSNPYFVTATTASVPPYFRPDTTQPGTSTTYDALGRTLTTTDGLGNKTTTSYSTEQPLSGNNITDTAFYEATSVIDANGHEHITLVDGFGRTRYVEQLMGNGTQNSPYALYGTTASVYDWLGDVTSVTGPLDYPNHGAGLNSAAQTTTTYDLLGRATGMSDADLGSGWTYTYDPDGNLLSSSDARKVTVYAGYDGLDRQLWRNTTNSATGAYVTYTYDSTANGNDGVGRLTGESFSGDALSGSLSTVYDGRGQATALTQTTTENASYTLKTAYNDAGQPTSLTYSDGEVFAPGYNAYGWLSSAVTVPSGGSQVNLLTNVGYSGLGGAALHPTSASIGNGTYSYSASYDNDVRLASVSESLASGGTTLFSSTRTYDNVGNVATVATTLAAGTDNQAFCYDEQNHLTWAGSIGTPPCTSTAITPGSLSSAEYSLSLQYDAMNRLKYNVMGGGNYQYPNGTTHAATSTVSGGVTQYSASYDADGDMVCRAPTSATTCTGSSPTGQPMTYDAERRLSHWQSGPGSNPASGADYLYDGSGQRIEQVDTSGGASTKVYYLFGGLEEVSSSGTTSTLTKYYSAGGILIGVNVGGTISYLASDGLGSVSEALSTSGTVAAAQLYGPYGGVRYSSGTMPTAKGFTGQRADATSGLDYYGARYYDPVLGQFTSADTKEGPNRFAYVVGNPETLSDPTGQRVSCPDPGGCGNWTPPLPPPPSSAHVVSDTTSGPITNSTTNSDHSTTTTTTRIRTVTYSDGSVRTFPLITTTTTCDKTCHAQRDEQAHADLAKMAVGAAGIAAGIGAIVYTLMNFEGLAAQAAVAALFGGNPLAAFFAEIAFTLASASYFLSNLDDFLQMTGRGGDTLDQWVDQLRVDADALTIVAATAAAATSIGTATLAALDATMSVGGAIFTGVVNVVGTTMADDFGQQFLANDQADK